MELCSTRGATTHAANEKTGNKKITASAKEKKSTESRNLDQCPVCEEFVEDKSELCQGQNAILCEGAWLHRRCAGLSQVAFKAARSSNLKFYCSHCRLDIQANEIASLKASMESLRSELDDLRNKVSSPTSPSSHQ